MCCRYQRPGYSVKNLAPGTVVKTLLTKLPGTFDIVTAERDCVKDDRVLFATADAEFT